MTLDQDRLEQTLRRHGAWVAAGLFAVTLLVRLWNIGGYIDEKDSVDHVRAARMGYGVNALDAGSRPIGDFLGDCVRILVLKADLHVWAADQANNDVAAYRHYHPPLFHYLLGLWIALFGTSDVALRLFGTLIGALMAPVLWWGWRTLFPASSRLPGLLAALFIAFDPLLSHLGKLISYKPLFQLLAVLQLVLLARAVRDRSARDLYLSALCLGLCLATFEMALLLFATCALTLLLVENPWLAVTRRGISASWAVVIAALIPLGVFFAVWPAGVLKPNFIKGCIVYAALSRHFLLTMPVSALLRWTFWDSPVMMVCAAIGLALVVQRVISRSAPGWVLPLAAFPGLVVLGNVLSKVRYPIHMSPIVPFVALLAGWGVWRVSARALRRPAWAGAAVVVLCAAVNMPALVRAGDYALRGWPQVIAFFDKKAVAGDRVFVSDNIEANVLAHYVPKLVVDRGYDWPAAVQDATGRMRRGEYRFVMLLVRPGRPQKARWSWQKSWPAATELPYYDAVKAKYPLVQSVKCDADEVVVELRERQGP